LTYSAETINILKIFTKPQQCDLTTLRNKTVTKIYPVAGGKGGIGKSFITANLGWLLAKNKKKVLLIDLDLGSANLHTMLGIQEPGAGLSDFLNKKATLIETVISCQIPGLFLLSAKGGSMEAANLPYAQTQKVINMITKLPFDFILLDLGAGTNFNTLDFSLTSKEVILIFNPEPTSIESGIRFIETVYYRKLKQLFKHHRINTIVKSFDKSTPSLTDIINVLAADMKNNGRALFEILEKISFKLIINQTRNQKSSHIGEALLKLCQRHFYSRFELIGTLEHEEKIMDAIISKQLFVKGFPRSRATYDLLKIAQHLSNPKDINSTQVKPFWNRDHYEVLDIHPDTSMNDIEQAYKSIESLYQDNPLVVDAFFTGEEKNSILEKIDTAGKTLCDPFKKRDYDRFVLKRDTGTTDNKSSLGEEKSPKVDTQSSPNKTARSPHPSQPVKQNKPEVIELIRKISSQHIISGDDLKNLRNISGLTTENVFEKTRIGATTLKVIEEDQFDALPPLIYLKGFLKAYAQTLQLPVAAVVDGYLKNIEKNTVTGHP